MDKRAITWSLDALPRRRREASNVHELPGHQEKPEKNTSKEVWELFFADEIL